MLDKTTRVTMTNNESRERTLSVRALLCDLDGTLIDSTEDIRRAMPGC